MHRRAFTAGAGALLAARAAQAAPATKVSGRLVVAELFTSQGCSSCPPADRLLTELADGGLNVLPLAFHVTYWDGLGWRDPFSLEVATLRQRWYRGLWRADEIYTPQLVVDGQRGVIGSDRDAVAGALRHAFDIPAVAVELRREGGVGVVDIARGAGPADIVLVGYDPRHTTQIGRGENGGRTLVESNIVRGLAMAGTWDGGQAQLRHPAPAGERLAVLLQGAGGVMLGAARES